MNALTFFPDAQASRGGDWVHLVVVLGGWDAHVRPLSQGRVGQEETAWKGEGGEGERGQGTDVILDFKKGMDLIDLSGDLTFGIGGNVSQVGRKLVFNQGGEDQEILAVLKNFRGSLDTRSFAS